MFLGIGFLVVVCGLAFFLVNPPKNDIPPAPASLKKAKESRLDGDLSPLQMMKTKKFYLLWIIFFIGSGAGLMVIGSVASMAKNCLGGMAFVAVAIMAVGNAAGRIVAGLLSDKIGRRLTLIIMLFFQAGLMFAAIPLNCTGSAVIWILLATLIGFNYGANLSLFPSFTKDLGGLKSFGLNYGIVFTAWGVGGLVMGRLSQTLAASTGGFNLSFIVAGIMLLIGAGLATRLKRRTRPIEERLFPIVTRDLILDRVKRGLKLNNNKRDLRWMDRL